LKQGKNGCRIVAASLLRSEVVAAVSGKIKI
jgi:hypothetical protein